MTQEHSPLPLTKTIIARTVIDLKAKIFKAEGWVHKVGDNKSARIMAAYDITVDVPRNQIIAKRKTIAKAKAVSA